MKWVSGRQSGNYQKLKILLLSRFDIWLIRYQQNHFIPPHKDDVNSGCVYRLNIILKSPKKGGDFHCEQCIINLSRIKLFKASHYIHSCSKIDEGTRLVLSIGLWLK